MSNTKVKTSQDGNGKGMDNTFPDGDNPVSGSPFAVGTTATAISLDGAKSNEVLVSINGATGGKCYLTFSNTRDADASLDFGFSTGAIVSVPNTGGELKAIGDASDIELRMFYSKGVS
jgi:hypothetical protein